MTDTIIIISVLSMYFFRKPDTERHLTETDKQTDRQTEADAFGLMRLVYQCHIFLTHLKWGQFIIISLSTSSGWSCATHLKQM